MNNLIFLLLLGVCLVPLVVLIPVKMKTSFSLITATIMAISGIVLATNVLLNDQTWTYTLAITPFFGKIMLEIDKLSAIFLLISCIMSVLVAFYAVGYLSKITDKTALNLHLISFGTTLFGMIAALTLPNMMTFLVAWEIMSVSSFLLILLGYQVDSYQVDNQKDNENNNEKENILKQAINYFVQMHVGAVFLLVGALIVHSDTGSFDFSSIKNYSGSSLMLFFVFFVGFGMKAGFLPMQSWLPKTHSVAPFNWSLMSTIMINMGIYGLFRILLYTPAKKLEIGIFLLIISVMTAIYGIVNAAMQKDLKKLLAFSSSENMGIVGIGMGLGTLGVALGNNSMAFLGYIGALLHVFNHTLFKSLLFYSAGAVYCQLGTKNIEQLGGVLKKMPYSGSFFLLASMAIAGLPPFNGFISEFLMYEGFLKGLKDSFVSVEVLLLIGMIGLTLTGGLSIYTFTKAFGLGFLGVPRTEKVKKAKEVGFLMLIPQILVTILILSVALAPTIYFHIYADLTHIFVPPTESIEKLEIYALERDAIITFVFLALIAVIFAIRTFKVRQNKQSYNATWGCGYLGSSPKIQYTATSYANYFVKLAAPIIGYKVKTRAIAPTDIFPTNRHFESEVYDKIEVGIINKIINALKWTLRKVAIIETGKTQHYILYAFMFMLLLFLLTFFNVL